MFFKDQHNLAYLNHYTHSIHLIHYQLKHVGSDEVNISRGVCIIVHSRFDSMFHNAKVAEDMSDVFCRDPAASIPPA